jgi:hypothetical protein
MLYTGLVIATVYGEPFNVPILCYPADKKAIKYGLGLHIWDVDPENAVSMQKAS